MFRGGARVLPRGGARSPARPPSAPIGETFTQDNGGNAAGRRYLCLFDWFAKYGLEQAASLARRGGDVVVHMVDHLGEFGGDEAERDEAVQACRASGARVVLTPARSWTGLLAETWALGKEIRAFKPDVVLVQDLPDPRHVLAALGSFAVMIVHDPRPHAGEEADTPMRTRVVQTVGRFAARASIVHSRALISELPWYSRRKPVVILPHGIRVAPRATPVPESRQIALLGRMYPYKGLDVAVRALELVRRIVPDLTLVIAGNGPEIERFVADPDRGLVVREGYLSRAQLHDTMRASRLLIFPYRDGTQSGAASEATGLGVPCIVSNVGGLPEVVPPGMRSYVVPKDDPRALASAIADAVDHGPEVRDAFLDHARVTASWDAVAVELETALTRLLQTRGAAS